MFTKFEEKRNLNKVIPYLIKHNYSLAGYKDTFIFSRNEDDFFEKAIEPYAKVLVAKPSYLTSNAETRHWLNKAFLCRYELIKEAASALYQQILDKEEELAELKKTILEKAYEIRIYYTKEISFQKELYLAQFGQLITQTKQLAYLIEAYSRADGLRKIENISNEEALAKAQNLIKDKIAAADQEEKELKNNRLFHQHLLSLQQQEYIEPSPNYHDYRKNKTRFINEAKDMLLDLEPRLRKHGQNILFAIKSNDILYKNGSIASLEIFAHELETKIDEYQKDKAMSKTELGAYEICNYAVIQTPEEIIVSLDEMLEAYSKRLNGIEEDAQELYEKSDYQEHKVMNDMPKEEKELRLIEMKNECQNLEVLTENIKADYEK